MAVLMTEPYQQFFDDNGDPLSGGKVYTYEAGTTTPKATYTNQGAGTPNANPVILDAAGRAEIWIDGSYKFVITTSSDVTIKTIDNVTNFTTSGTTLNSILPSQTGNSGKSLVTDGSNSSWGYSGPPYAAFIGKVLYGLVLSNNGTDATNDIDVSAGAAVSDDGITLMTLGSSYTKRLDAAWAVGTGNGGLDTGAIADTTYHIWLIHRTDTAVTDVLFSASATSPTMPTSYTKKKLIGSIIRTSSAIKLFSQYEIGGGAVRTDWLVPVRDIGANNPGTSAVSATLTSIPTGRKLQAIISASLTHGGAIYGLITSLDQTDSTPSSSFFNIGGDNDGNSTTFRTRTNTSSQIRYRISTSGAGSNMYITTEGFLDAR